VQDRRIAVAAGVGAGIGSIFRAPLGGAVLAAEILYIQDLEVEALIPGLIASIVWLHDLRRLLRFGPIFGTQAGLTLGSPVQILYYAMLGVLCGLVGILYAKSFYGITDVFHRIHVPRAVKPAIAASSSASWAWSYRIAHMGYGWVQLVMGQEIMGLPIWCCWCSPSPRSWPPPSPSDPEGRRHLRPGHGDRRCAGRRLLAPRQRRSAGMPTEPGGFVIVGMMALFGGIAHARSP